MRCTGCHIRDCDNENLKRWHKDEVERLWSERRTVAADLDAMRAMAVELRETLKNWHLCATVRDDGTCNGCEVSEMLIKSASLDDAREGKPDGR